MSSPLLAVNSAYCNKERGFKAEFQASLQGNIWLWGSAPNRKTGGGMEIRPERKATPEIKPLISNYGVVRGSGKASTQTFIVLDLVNASLKMATAL